MSKLICVALVGVVAVAIGMVSALTEDEISTLRGVVVPILVGCRNEFKFTKEQVLAVKESHDFDSLNPCYYACFFKKTGVLNDQGLYDTESAKKLHQKYIHGEEDQKKADSVTDTCSKVNDEAVSDGVQGCERAKLLVRCLTENKMASIDPLSLVD